MIFRWFSHIMLKYFIWLPYTFLFAWRRAIYLIKELHHDCYMKLAHLYFFCPRKERCVCQLQNVTHLWHGVMSSVGCRCVSAPPDTMGYRDTAVLLRSSSRAAGESLFWHLEHLLSLLVPWSESLKSCPPCIFSVLSSPAAIFSCTVTFSPS